MAQEKKLYEAEIIISYRTYDRTTGTAYGLNIEDARQQLEYLINHKEETQSLIYKENEELGDTGWDDIGIDDDSWRIDSIKF